MTVPEAKGTREDSNETRSQPLSVVVADESNDDEKDKQVWIGAATRPKDIPKSEKKNSSLTGISHSTSTSRTMLHHSLSSIANAVPTIPFFISPRQRQRWGDLQVHPHKNWGDTFFDLFYVAAVYNLGNLLREDPTSKGILYLVGCFWPIMMCWQNKLYHDSRYTTIGEDVWHRLYETATLVPTATAVLHIVPVALLSHPEQYVEMFAFCASITAGLMLSMGRNVEIMICQKYLPENQKVVDSGEKEVKMTVQQHDSQHHHEDHAAAGHHGHSDGPVLCPESFVTAQRDLSAVLVPTIFAVAATIYSGLQYYGEGSNDDEIYPSSNASSTTNTSSYHRFLAAAEEDLYATSSQGDDIIPICLLIAGSTAPQAYFALQTVSWKWRKVDHKAISIPMNINYAIHRYGEWVMLMLGESVLSLLIVDISEKKDYFTVFYFGIVSIILLEYLHFRSQPHNPDEHAMRRSANAGLCFTILMTVYSTCLIILGASYKMFLFEYVYEDAKEDKSSSYGADTESAAHEEDAGHRLLFSPLVSRWLAGGESAALRFDTDDRRQRIAHLFSWSLALVWFCLDAMTLAHRGIQTLCKAAESEATHRIKATVVLFLIARVLLIAFIASLSQYETDPSILSILGFAGILAQLGLRSLGFYLLPPENDDEAELEAIEKTLQYATARIRENSAWVQSDSLRRV